MSGIVSTRIIERATDTLVGILAGISIDYELNDLEVTALSNWLDQNIEFSRIEPFSEIQHLLHEALRDQVIDADERESIIEYCNDLRERSGPIYQDVTQVTRVLHGLLAGLAADGTVTDREILDLRDWLEDYSALRDLWPFSDARFLIEQVLHDGKVSDPERDQIVLFCRQFTDKVVDDGFGFALREASECIYKKPESPVVQTLSYILSDQPLPGISGYSFCFTGISRFGTRRELANLLIQNGGSHSTGMTSKLDYLVVGALSQPAWAYSVYGRKIEKAMELQARTGNPVIIGEELFLSACGIYV